MYSGGGSHVTGVTALLTMLRVFLNRTHCLIRIVVEFQVFSSCAHDGSREATGRNDVSTARDYQVLLPSRPVL